MKNENLIMGGLTVVLGIIAFGGSIALAVVEQKRNQEKLDYIAGSKWWKNLMGNVIVKVLKVYPKSDKIVYTKYSETGRNLGTCQMDFNRFINTYEHAMVEYRF